MLLKPTDKLYYGKYPYKIDFDLYGVSLLRVRGLDWAKEYCNDKNRLCSWVDEKRINRKELKKFILALEPYITKEDGFKTRTEGSRFSYYTADLDEIKTLSKELKWCCSETWGPTTQQELDYLLSNRRKMLCDALPYEQYRFKVFLRENTPVGVRTQFHTWKSNYTQDDIKVSGSTEYWLSGSKRYVQSPFFYIKDEKLLTFASLFLSSHVKTVYEYIPRHTVI